MKVLTVVSSNTGRSIGDVFLALYSSNHLTERTDVTGLLTHGNHAEVASFFRKSLDFILLSEAPAITAKSMQLPPVLDIHWIVGKWDKRMPGIQNPWLYFVMNAQPPGRVKLEVPPMASRIGGNSLVIFPERSDNHRLGESVFGSLVESALKRGMTVYTNCYLNSNYASSPALPGTLPLEQLSLAETIAIASDPTNVLAGNRSGIFDVLYFAVPPNAARLIIVYPLAPPWLWATCRFANDTMEKRFPQYYAPRRGVLELKAADVNGDTLAAALDLV